MHNVSIQFESGSFEGGERGKAVVNLGLIAGGQGVVS